VAPGPDDADLTGKTLNRRYLVEQHIGEGGFGDVYRAKQIQMDREVAIKVLAPGMSQDENLVARFRREAKSACNLRDPHTIITYDFDETENGLLYIAMELLQGETLFDVMEDLTLVPAARTAGILEQCCTSLGEAHSMNIVHRDIKPENVFLEHRTDYPDFVKILDFGIAKIVAGDLAQGPQLTAAGQTLGTLEYMSPEQLMGKQLDGRSDIYALGMLAYQMLTGTLPFSSDSPASIIQWQLKELPQPVSSLVPTVPQDFDPIILKMLAKDRDDRYSAVSQLREDLRQMMSRQGWLVGGGTGPMTAIPQAPLPGAPSQPAPVAGSRPVGADNAAAAMLPTSGAPQKKSNLPLIIVLVLVALGVVGFGLWFFVLRGGGGGDSKASSKAKTEKGMTVAKEGMKRPAAMRFAAKLPDAMRPGPSRPEAMAPTPRRAVARRPSLGGLLGVLGGRASASSGSGKATAGLGALLGVAQKLPAPGKIRKGRRSRAGIKASEKNPLRVIPPEMTLWGQVDMDALRKTRWGRQILAKIPSNAFKTLTTMGLSPAKIGTVAMGLNFKKVAAGKEEPIMLFAVSGDLKAEALLRALNKEKGKPREMRVAGHKVLVKDDLHLVLPSDKLVLFSSTELIRHGLSRMSSKSAKSAAEGGWGKELLEAMGATTTPHLLFAMALPPNLQKQSSTLLAQLKAGAGATVLNFMFYGVASGRGLALTLAATCNSAGVAAKLKMLLPLMVKLLSGKIPAPFNSLVAGVRFEARGKVFALRLDLDEAKIGLISTLLLAAAK
jgi:tRNA A-37 threonylcarbamoyl transferase component Bud32